jgi:outer membrane lipoprotein-sorting protein
MLKQIFLKLTVMIFLVSGTAFPTNAQDGLSADEIVQKADQKFKGKSSIGTMRMTIVRPSWKRTIEMKTWSLGDDYFMVYITAPAKEKGQAFLKRQNEMWNWIPTIERLIKLPPSMMMQSWMGSDFTNDDLMKESSIVKDYDKKIVGSETFEGLECYKIQLLPKPEAAVVWGKIIIWISQKEFFQMKAEYYDEFGDRVQTMTGSNIKLLDDRKLPATLTIKKEDKPGEKTILEFTAIDFNVPIEKSFFSQQRMKRIH